MKALCARPVNLAGKLKCICGKAGFEPAYAVVLFGLAWCVFPLSKIYLKILFTRAHILTTLSCSQKPKHSQQGQVPAFRGESGKYISFFPLRLVENLVKSFKMLFARLYAPPPTYQTARLLSRFGQPNTTCRP